MKGSGQENEAKPCERKINFVSIFFTNAFFTKKYDIIRLNDKTKGAFYDGHIRSYESASQRAAV